MALFHRYRDALPARPYTKFAITIKKTIDDLPEELLCSIFWECMYPRGTWKIGPSAPPWILCRVCSRWRTAALNYKNLWTWIYLDILGYRVDGGRPPTPKLLEYWLERSGGQPLDLVIKEWPRESDHDPGTYGSFDLVDTIGVNYVTKFDKLLRRNIWRWRSLQLLAGPDCFTIVEAPMLEYFSYWSEQQQYTEHITQPKICPFTSLVAPRLKELILEVVLDEPDVYAPRSSYATLTHLSLANYWVGTCEILDFIAQAPVLKTLYVKVDNCNRETRSRLPSLVTHTKLSLLECMWAPQYMLAHLALPNLRVCSLDTYHDTPENEMGDDEPTVTSNILQFLSSAMNLECLIINEMEFDFECDWLIDQLTIAGPKDNICTLLKHVEFNENCGAYDAADYVLHRFISSRTAESVEEECYANLKYICIRGLVTPALRQNQEQDACSEEEKALIESLTSEYLLIDSVGTYCWKSVWDRLNCWRLGDLQVPYSELAKCDDYPENYIPYIQASTGHLICGRQRAIDEVGESLY